MTRVLIELIFADRTQNKRVEVEVKGVVDARFLGRLDTAVNKQYKAENWERWNLIDVIS